MSWAQAPNQKWAPFLRGFWPIELGDTAPNGRGWHLMDPQRCPQQAWWPETDLSIQRSCSHDVSKSLPWLPWYWYFLLQSPAWLQHCCVELQKSSWEFAVQFVSVLLCSNRSCTAIEGEKKLDFSLPAERFDSGNEEASFPPTYPYLLQEHALGSKETREGCRQRGCAKRKPLSAPRKLGSAQKFKKHRSAACFITSFSRPMGLPTTAWWSCQQVCSLKKMAMHFSHH